MTDFRHAWLAAESAQADSPTDLVSGHFDVLLTTASWDSRCLCLHDCELDAGRAIGIFFSNRGDGALRDRHDPQVDAFIERVGGASRRIDQRSEELEALWGAVWDEFMIASDAHTGPMRVLLDLSTCPRYYAMALIAAGFRTHRIAELVIFYAEGKYPPPTDEDPHEPFTFGRWETVPVPLLEGRSDPALPRHYIVSVGFEGSKTLRAVSSEGADNVTVIFPRPGVAPAYEERTREANQILLDDFGVDDSAIIDAPAGDAVATWKILAEQHDRWNRDDAFYLPAGTKPHAIGMALDALIGGRVTVMYAKPATHKEVEIKPLGHYWLFTVRDLTAFKP
jgi:hypothetical protein